MGNCPNSSILLFQISILNRDSLNKGLFNEDPFLFRGLLLLVLILWRCPCRTTTTHTLVPTTKVCFRRTVCTTNCGLSRRSMSKMRSQRDCLPNCPQPSPPISLLQTPEILPTPSTSLHRPLPRHIQGKGSWCNRIRNLPRMPTFSCCTSKSRKAGTSHPLYPLTVIFLNISRCLSRCIIPCLSPCHRTTRSSTCTLRCKANHRACLLLLNESSQCQCLLSTCRHL